MWKVRLSFSLQWKKQATMHIFSRMATKWLAWKESSCISKDSTVDLTRHARRSVNRLLPKENESADRSSFVTTTVGASRMPTTLHEATNEDVPLLCTRHSHWVHWRQHSSTAVMNTAILVVHIPSVESCTDSTVHVAFQVSNSRTVIRPFKNFRDAMVVHKKILVHRGKA